MSGNGNLSKRSTNPTNWSSRRCYEIWSWKNCVTYGATRGARRIAKRRLRKPNDLASLEVVLKMFGCWPQEAPLGSVFLGRDQLLDQRFFFVAQLATARRSFCSKPERTFDFWSCGFAQRETLLPRVVSSASARPHYTYDCLEVTACTDARVERNEVGAQMPARSRLAPGVHDGAGS